MVTSNIILSSSPSRPVTIYAMSSSPLPSPSNLFKKPIILCAGSRATSIPPGASTCFTTGSALLKTSKIGSTAKRKSAISAPNNHGLGDTKETEVPVAKSKRTTAKEKDGEEPKSKPGRKRKSDATTVEDRTLAPVSKTPRKPRAQKSEESSAFKEGKLEVVKRPRAKKADNDPTGVPKDKPARKPRAKKNDDTSQTKIPTNKISKPSIKKSKNSDKRTEGVLNTVGFGLLDAVKRKKAWTPPASTAVPTSATPESTLILDTNLDAIGLGGSTRPAKGFGDLFGSFGFTNGQSSTAALASGSSATNQVTVKKRKLTELVSTNNSETSVSPVKKAPKKKPRTITELATAAYAEIEGSAEPAPLLRFFSRQSTSGSTNNEFKVPAKRRSKSPVKGTKQAPILLSPESAMKQVANQDFVFGTSSQLAREESPTVLHDLHEAIQASLDHSDLFDYPHDDFSQANTKGNLWKAASRDIYGELLEIKASPPALPLLSKQSSCLPTAGDDSFLDIEILSNQQKAEQLPPPSAQVEVSQTSDLPSSSPKIGSPTTKAAKPATAAAMKSPKSKTTTKLKVLEMPDFATYTTAKLAKEVASYRFKPVKSRDGMITLLERCWEGKHQAALQLVDPNLPKKSSKKATEAPAPSELSPKRPRGRPRKASSATTSPITKVKPGRPKKTFTTLEADKDINSSTPKKRTKAKDLLEEISDSDIPLTPSPPRRRALQVGQPPLPLQLSTDILENSPQRTSSQEQALLFEHITKAVTSASPSKDSTNPSWHEKMLLYDPIVLEDLAVWLNTGALGKAGWDGEVAPVEVKKWCEGKSICCLWKENLRGGNRSRY